MRPPTRLPAHPAESTPERFESDATSVAHGIVDGADPLTLRFLGEDEQAGVCRAEPEATSCEAELSFLESGSVQQSFLADAVDVPDLRNDDGNAELLQAKELKRRMEEVSNPCSRAPPRAWCRPSASSRMETSRQR